MSDGQRKALVYVGLAVAVLVVAGVVRAAASHKDAGTCDLTEASLTLVAAGIQKEHSVGDILAEAAGGFLAVEACKAFVKNAVEDPSKAQSAEVEESDGETSTQSVTGNELAAAEAARSARISAIVARASACKAYQDAQFGECLDGDINPP
jgi:hypothetical protein